jgi:hypothetical protein
MSSNETSMDEAGGKASYYQHLPDASRRERRGEKGQILDEVVMPQGKMEIRLWLLPPLSRYG